MNPSHRDTLVVSSLGLLQIKLLWTIVYRFFWKHELSFLWDKYAEVQLLGHMVSVCLVFLRVCQTVFHNGCTILHSLKPCARELDSPHPHQSSILLLFFFNFSCSNSSDLEHLFMCLLAISILSLVKCLFISFSHFRIEFILFLMSCLRVLNILKVCVLCQNCGLQIFSPVCHLSFHPLTGCFAE